MQWRDAFRRRFARKGPEPPSPWSETDSVCDGRTAVDRVEHATGAALASDLPAAIGLALTGRRVSVTCGDGPGLAAAMEQAARRHVPLVAHFDGVRVHRTVRALEDAGALVLFARTGQEAVDLTLLARRVAERALVPAVVAMDAADTAHSVQDVRIPGAGGVLDLLGHPEDLVPSPTPAQEMLFGKSRRRVPRWLDPAHPALHGATMDAVADAAAQAARDPFVLDAVAGILAEETAHLASRTGRALDAVTARFLDDAELVLVAQGSLVENAEAVARELRASEGRKVGVVGIRCLRPFPAATVAAHLHGRPAVAVLERTDRPFGGDPPLTRDVRAALGTDAPKLVTALCGGDGLPVRAVDLAELCRQPGSSPWRVLGVDFLPPATIDPKRQVLLDRLRREYPDTVQRGLRCEKELALRGDDRPLVLAAYSAPGDPSWAGCLGEAADLLHRAAGSAVRTVRVDATRERLFAGASSPAPGADVGVELAVALLGVLPDGVDAPHPLQAALDELAPGGMLLVVGPRDVERVIARMPYSLQRTVRRGSIRIAALRIGGARDGVERQERLLGALAGLLAGRMPGLDAARLEAARRERLADAGDALDARLEAFRFGRDNTAFPDVNEVFEPTITPLPPAEPETPLAARQLARTDERWDSLPRFWDQTGVLYREGRVAQLSPDPYLELRSMPPLSSAFRRRRLEYETLPELDPARCTGCGACWTACPDGAIAARALPARALLDRGLAMAGERGANVSVLRSVVSKLAPLIEQSFAAEAPPATFADAARAAFDALVKQTQPPEDRRRSLAEALDAVLEDAGALPLARTETFADELLTLAIDPNACQGCASCVAVCEPGALAARPITTRRSAAAQAASRLVAELPDTAAGTLSRVAASPDAGPAAAALLGARTRASFVGGSGAAPGSGSQLALRLVLAALESGRATLREEQQKEIRDLQERFAQSIRDGLLHSVPTDDLDAISDGLKALGRRDVEVARLVERLEEACGSERVDGARLGRLVDAANDLANLAHRLERPRQATYGTVLGGESLAAWAAAFPHNPFAGPVVVDRSDDALRLAWGLVQAAVRDTVEAARTRRHAEHVLAHTHPGVPAELPEAWEQLTDAERGLCPPILVVLDAAAWGRARLADAGRLLGGNVPVIVAVVSATADEAAGTVAVAWPGAGAWHGTIAHADAVVTRVADAAAAGGPAWIHVLGPDPVRAGLRTDGARAEALRCTEAGLLPVGPASGTAATAVPATAVHDASAPGKAAAEQAAREADGAAREEMAERLTRRLMELAGYTAPDGGGNG